jgi:hypothetical protein
MFLKDRNLEIKVRKENEDEYSIRSRNRSLKHTRGGTSTPILHSKGRGGTSK